MFAAYQTPPPPVILARPAQRGAACFLDQIPPVNTVNDSDEPLSLADASPLPRAEDISGLRALPRDQQEAVEAAAARQAELRLSNKEVADRVGVPYMTWRNFRYSQRYFSIGNLLRLSHALRISFVVDTQRHGPARFYPVAGGAAWQPLDASAFAKTESR